MGTRAAYVFDDGRCQHAVCKHWDSCPEETVEFLNRALKLAWELPRFEADEFAAAFVAANKTTSGNIRLLNADPETWPTDLAFRYRVAAQGAELRVDALRSESGSWKALGENMTLAELEACEGAGEDE